MDKKDLSFMNEFTFGSDFNKGVYLVEVKQGENLNVLHLMKE